jgi:hypothetical protein
VPHRDKMPTLSDYDPARQRTRDEEARLKKLFPGRGPLEERVTRLESVAFDVTQEQIRVAPQIAQAHDWVNNEQNANTSAMAYADRMYNLLADVKRTQRVREARGQMQYLALAAVVLVVVAGLWAKADAATLASICACVGGVALAIINKAAQRQGQTRADDGAQNSLPPPGKHPPSSG